MRVRAGELCGDRRAFGRRRTEIAWQQIGVFVEFRGRRDLVDGKDNVIDGRASGLEARVDILADLLDLRPHIALADDISGLVARDLAAYDKPMPAIAQRDLRGGRRGRAGCSDDDRGGQIRDDLPVCVGPLNVALGLSLPFRQPKAVVYQVEFAVDDGPGIRIHGVLVRRRVIRHAHGTITVILRRIAVRVFTEQVAMLAAGKAPA